MSRVESDFKNCLKALKMAEVMEEMAEETKLKTHTLLACRAVVSRFSESQDKQ